MKAKKISPRTVRKDISAAFEEWSISMGRYNGDECDEGRAYVEKAHKRVLDYLRQLERGQLQEAP